MKAKTRMYRLDTSPCIIRESPLGNLSRERLEVYFNDLFHVLIAEVASLPSRATLSPTEEARINWLLGQVLEVKKALIHRFTEGKR